ncbi:MAG: MarR family transcriptional regulator [Pelagibacterales bacterium]|nr:MarR family transcriptional regulator [Pelagibacterales bacterium]|tara:strand:- start:429 stop:1088 length:660 start_codon:yes stop_codon:yes gene_type:complete
MLSCSKIEHYKVLNMSNKDNKHNDMTLELLSAVEADSRITQRSLANTLGIALGLTNSYLKKCIEKGLVKIKQVPANRYAYYLTPSGFTEKSRLTAEYLKASFSFYRRAKTDLTNIIDNCYNNNKFRIILSDFSELSEIATIISLSRDIELVGIISNNDNGKVLNNIPVIRNIKTFRKFDAVIITDIYNTKSRYEYLSKIISPNKIMVPNLISFENKGDN